MDLMQPPLWQQPSPARWLGPGAPLDVRQFIQEAMLREPHSTSDQIAAQLAQRGIELPATVVAAWMQKMGGGSTVVSA